MHQKSKDIGGQGVRDRSLDEFHNQVMYKLFDNLSDSDDKVEDRANGGGEVTDVNANNHAGGDDNHQNHNSCNRLPAHATTKHAYKSNNCRIRGNG